MQILNQNESTASLRCVFFILLDSATGQVKQTGKAGTLAGYVTKADGVTTAKAGSFVELDATNAPGLYYYQAATGELDVLGPIIFSFTCAACLDRTVMAYVGNTNVKLSSDVATAITAAEDNVRGADSDDLKDISDELDDAKGAGFSPATHSLKQIRGIIDGS